MGEEDSEVARYIQTIKHCKLYIFPLFFCGLSFSLGHSIQVDCPIIPHINHVDPELCLGYVYDTLYSLSSDPLQFNFTCIISFNIYNNSMRQVLLIFHFKDEGTEVWQMLSKGSGIWTQAAWTLNS